MSARVAVYGGSFDPPHVAHLFVATWVLACGEVDELLFIPTAAHSLGKSAAVSFDDRCAMVECLAARLPRASVSRIEDELPRPSRTLVTLEALRERRPDDSFRLVVGADIAAEVTRWHRWDAVVELAPPIWIGRTGHPMPSGALIALPEISSTAIRASLRAGASVRGLVPADVLALVESRGLYREGR